MDFNSFICKLVDIISERIEEDEDVIRYDAIKNNDTKLHGIVIKNATEKVSPTIYLERYYEKYLAEQNLECIADEIIKLSRLHRNDINISSFEFENYENVKDELYAKLIGKDSNNKLLEHVPYKKFLDLAIVVYFDVSKWCGMNASVLVKKEHIKMWGIDEEELFDLAIKNAYIKNGYSISNIFDLLGANLKDTIQNSLPMYVMTNKIKYYGAICMIYEDAIKEFCINNNCDVYIIPSSIHEIIIVPLSDEKLGYNINDAISIVNETELDREDVLSNHGYIYSRENGYEMI